MLRVIVHHPDILLDRILQPIVAMGDTPALSVTIAVFRSLLGSNDMDSSFGEHIDYIFKSTNEFSINLCRISLSLLLEYSRLSRVGVVEKSGELVERIIASVIGGGQLGKNSGDLVKSLNVESKQLVMDPCCNFNDSCETTLKSPFWKLHPYAMGVCRMDKILRYGVAKRSIQLQSSWRRLLATGFPNPPVPSSSEQLRRHCSKRSNVSEIYSIMKINQRQSLILMP